eukprot:321032-Chlamydomonas_euryale.AAC.1
MAGHLGRDKMFSRLSDNFYWPRMKMHVQDYCRTCPVCQAAKPTSQRQLGLHQPLAIPKWIGQLVSMDFIVELPRSTRGHTAILVVVDRLTKRVALEPTTTHVTAQPTCSGRLAPAPTAWHEAQHEHAIPSLDRWSDKESQQDSGGHAQIVRFSVPVRLGQLPSKCCPCHQHSPARQHQGGAPEAVS